MRAARLREHRFRPSMGGANDDPLPEGESPLWIRYQSPDRGWLLRVREQEVETQRHILTGLGLPTTQDGTTGEILARHREVLDSSARNGAARDDLILAFVRDHLVGVEGLVLPDSTIEARERPASEPEGIAWVLEQPALIQELYVEIADSGRLRRAEGKA